MRRVLRRRGSPAATIDDALQTAAERALTRAEPFDSLQGWLNWTITVAWHEVQAQWRRQARSVQDELLDAPGGPDPAVIVDRYLQIEAVERALARVSESDRRAILEALDDSFPTRPLAAQEKMRRYRARRRLAAIIASWDDDP